MFLLLLAHFFILITLYSLFMCDISPLMFNSSADSIVHDNFLSVYINMVFSFVSFLQTQVGCYMPWALIYTTLILPSCISCETEQLPCSAESTKFLLMLWPLVFALQDGWL